MHFEWDNKKAVENIKKHGVSFEEAQTIFFDALTRVATDPDHSKTKDRFIALGYSSLRRVLLVVHCYRKKSAVIRLISARKLTRSERKQFEEDL